jgi:hypothetical protein
VQQLQQFLTNLAANQKAYIAALGLVGLAMYQFSQGDRCHAWQSLLAGLAAAGIRHETAPAAQS